MANVSVGWEVEGIISTGESVSSMLKVVSTKTLVDTGKFFTWEGKVSLDLESHWIVHPTYVLQEYPW